LDRKLSTTYWVQYEFGAAWATFRSAAERTIGADDACA
jgi:hypothetical protein